MKKVSKKEFFEYINPLDVHPKIVGNFPYTSIFETRSRQEVGRIVETKKEGKYPHKKEYFLNN
jgi:hypothetical protein